MGTIKTATVRGNEKSKIPKTTNILRCTLRPIFSFSEFYEELPDIELYMLCSNKIADTARKLEGTDVVDIHNNDPRKWHKYLNKSNRLGKKIVKAFNEQIKYEVDHLGVNPDTLPSGTRSELELLRNALIDDLDPEFLLIAKIESFAILCS
jgi:hypothetical protein